MINTIPDFTIVDFADDMIVVCATPTFAGRTPAALLRDAAFNTFISINGARPMSIPSEDAARFVVDHGTFSDRLKLTDDGEIEDVHREHIEACEERDELPWKWSA